MRTKSNGILTPKEEEVMNYFWERGPLFVREVVQIFPEPRPHFNTVSTVVRGLEEKRFLSHTEYGSTFQYYPVVTREEFNKMSLKGVIGKYFNNSVMSAVSYLVEEEGISVDELKKLISMVEKKK